MKTKTRKLILFMHVSLDGFVAGPKGEMNWIKVDEEIFDYVGQRVALSDTALYGRVTYDMMEGYWPTAGDPPGASKHDREHSQWYKHAKKIVVSRSLKGASRPNTQIISENLSAEITAIKAVPGPDILIFGSPSAAHALQKEKLTDGYWLFVNPTLLGEGVPLFASGNKAALRLMQSHAFSNGVICLSYENAG